MKSSSSENVLAWAICSLLGSQSFSPFHKDFCAFLVAWTHSSTCSTVQGNFKLVNLSEKDIILAFQSSSVRDAENPGA